MSTLCVLTTRLQIDVNNDQVCVGSLLSGASSPPLRPPVSSSVLYQMVLISILSKSELEQELLSEHEMIIKWIVKRK